MSKKKCKICGGTGMNYVFNAKKRFYIHVKCRCIKSKQSLDRLAEGGK